MPIESDEGQEIYLYKDKQRAFTDEYIHRPDCSSTSVVKWYYVHLLIQRIELMEQEEKNKLNGKKEQNVELIE